MNFLLACFSLAVLASEPPVSGVGIGDSTYYEPGEWHYDVKKDNAKNAKAVQTDFTKQDVVNNNGENPPQNVQK